MGWRCVLVRRLAAAGTALLLAVCGAGRPAHADDASEWTEDLRDKRTLQRVTEGIGEIFRGKERLYWDRGPVFETEKKALAIHLGWEFQTDFIAYGDMSPAVVAAAGEDWNCGPYVWRRRGSFSGKSMERP